MQSLIVCPSLISNLQMDKGPLDRNTTSDQITDHSWTKLPAIDMWPTLRCQQITLIALFTDCSLWVWEYNNTVISLLLRIEVVAWPFEGLSELFHFIVPTRAWWQMTTLDYGMRLYNVNSCMKTKDACRAVFCTACATCFKQCMCDYIVIHIGAYCLLL